LVLKSVSVALTKEDVTPQQTTPEPSTSLFAGGTLLMFYLILAAVHFHNVRWS
jgi:hypothetical protein